MDEIEIDEMIAEARGVIDDIDEQIEAIGKRESYPAPKSPHLVRDKDGRYLTAPLLRAKSECLSALSGLYAIKAALCATYKE